MRKARTLVLTTHTDYWASLTSISTNLTAAYKNVAGESISFLTVSSESLEEDVWMRKEYISDLAKKIVKEKFDRIIMKDSHQHIPHLVAGIQAAYPEGNGPEWIIHLYGDFSLRAADWFHAGDILKGASVRFICASHAQKKLVDHFSVSKNTAVIPYPVDGDFFRFDPKLRKKKTNEKILLYTGRLSQQKNINALLATFAKLDQSFRLILAGSYDDIGSQTLGMIPPLGFSFHSIQTYLHSLPRDVQNRIQFVGNKTPLELKRLYCEADVFVSLSLYHDEDYGMSLAEALATGLPSVVTGWGGYLDIAERSEITSIIPVRLGKNGFVLPIDQIARKIISLSKKKNDRKASGENIKSVSGKLKKLLDGKPSPAFKGFKENLLSFGTKTQALIPGTDPEYKSIYSSYFQGRN